MNSDFQITTMYDVTGLMGYRIYVPSAYECAAYFNGCYSSITSIIERHYVNNVSVKTEFSQRSPHIVLRIHASYRQNRKCNFELIYTPHQVTYNLRVYYIKDNKETIVLHLMVGCCLANELATTIKYILSRIQ